MIRYTSSFNKNFTNCWNLFTRHWSTITTFKMENIATSEENEKFTEKVKEDSYQNEDQKSAVTKHADLVSGSKRKVAMLLAYCGENYYGMAMNRGDRKLKTIESTLIAALVDAKVVPENCWEDPNKMSYKIASRTDKGVSTCGQIASMKLILNEKVVDLINEKLPNDIRVLAVKRTTQGFGAQHWAGSRTYSYTLPTYAFANTTEISDSYVITPEKLAHVHSIMEKFKGTHGFHNFTSGKRMGDMSAQRYIMEFEHNSPFLQHDIQFMTFKIKGQSFMIHQIRKMFGLMIAIISGCASEGYFDKAFSEPLLDIPKAPGTGLVLEEVHYDAYNNKFEHLHGGIDFSKVQNEIEEFRQNRILPYIYRSEVEQAGMMEWIQTLSFHDFTGVRAKEDWRKMNERTEVSEEGKLATEDEEITPENCKDNNGNTVETKNQVNSESTLEADVRDSSVKRDICNGSFIVPCAKKAKSDVISSPAD